MSFILQYHQRPLQTHRSIHNFSPLTSKHSSPRWRCNTLSSSPSNCHATQTDINISFTHHTVSEIDKVLTTTNTLRDSDQIHVSHPAMSIHLNYLRRLHKTWAHRILITYRTVLSIITYSLVQYRHLYLGIGIYSLPWIIRSIHWLLIYGRPNIKVVPHSSIPQPI